MWSDARCCRIGSHIESFTIQETGGSRSLLDSLNHRGKQVSIQCRLIQKPGYVGFGYHNDMDIGHGIRMMKRQGQLVFINTFHIELT